MIELQVKRYAALCQFRRLVMSLPAAEIVVFGQDGLIGLELNSKGSNFRSSAVPNNEQSCCVTPRAWRVLYDYRLSDLEWSL